MRHASPALIALLNTGQFQMCDLWTITLSGGVVLRYTNADIPIKWDGQTYAVGPGFRRSSITDTMGVEASTLSTTIEGSESDTINGVPLIVFIRSRGFDGATVKLDRAFFPEWGDPVTGSVLRFAGRVTSIGDIGGAAATLTVSSWTILLNVSMPPNVYQVPCMNTVYDPVCGLDANSFEVTGAIDGISSSTDLDTNLSQAVGYFSQGRILFSTGPNAGVSRAVKSSASGNLQLVSPLPVPPNVGDEFSAWPGCDWTTGTCETKFNNKLRYKATPYVPVPETAV